MPITNNMDAWWDDFESTTLIPNTVGTGVFSQYMVMKKARKDDEMLPLPAKDGFLFGCDPELFVFNDKGEPVPADMIPGTKSEPYVVPKGAIQQDGMAAEFNIDPVDNFEDFWGSIVSVKKELEKFLPKGYELRAVPSVRFAPEVFDNASDIAKVLGCQPDVNAWDGEINPPPSLPKDPYLRCAGGHIHIGWRKGGDKTAPQHIMNCFDLVKQLDWYLAGWSLKMDDDATRRKLYGKAGSCRVKDYGVEYRVLSNFWLTSKDRCLSTWNRLQTAIQMMSKHYLPDRAGEGASNLLRESINKSVLHEVLAVHNFPFKSVNIGYSQF